MQSDTQKNCPGQVIEFNISRALSGVCKPIQLTENLRHPSVVSCNYAIAKYFVSFACCHILALGVDPNCCHSPAPALFQSTFRSTTVL